MSTLKGKTLLISGGSRGIGLAIAKRAAQDGANIAICAKTSKPHPKLEGTIFTACEEIEEAGGQALPVVMDVREEASVAEAVTKVADHFGSIDICINNASAISLTPTDKTQMRRFDLMHQVNMRGTFMLSKYCLPFLETSENPHILNISPPLAMEPKWFAPHVAYSMAKYGMSLCVLGMAGEFKNKGIGVNALWPRTTIATAAVQNLLGGDMLMRASRTPQIMGDAAHAVLTQNAKEITGNFFIDDLVLYQKGVRDFDGYRVDPSQPLQLDFFLPNDLEQPEEISLKALK